MTSAILYGDDPLVRAMAEHCRAAVSFFGTTSDCQVVINRVDAAEAAWPDRLSKSVRLSDERAQIRTQLVGSHWVNAVSAAIAAAAALDSPL